MIKHIREFRLSGRDYLSSRKNVMSSGIIQILEATKNLMLKNICIREKIEANQIKTIPMGTGNKSSRSVARTVLSKEGQKEWRETIWKVQ